MYFQVSILKYGCTTYVSLDIVSLLPGQIIHRFGVGATTTFVMLLWCVRFLCFSALTNPWLVLPVEFFSGWCVALTFPVINTIADEAVPPGTQTTTIAIAMAAYDGIGESQSHAKYY